METQMDNFDREWEAFNHREDPLAPARGIVLGLVLGALLWVLIAALVVAVVR